MSTASPGADDAARRRRHRNERIAAAILVLACIGVAVAMFAWRRVEEAEYDKVRTYIPRPAKITPEVELLAEYVRIDTSTPEGVAAGARWLAAQLRKGGVEPEIIESAEGRLNVYARIRGRSRGDGLLLFNHIDVVPAGEGWQQPPFGAKVVGDQLYGRGTLDMKGLAICQLLAFLDVARSGKPPEHDLVFLATADEETGSELGMKWILANRRDVIEGIRYGITEGGVTEMMRETLTYFGIETGGKQVVRATLYGKSLEEAREARFALEPYIASYYPERLLPEVAAHLREKAGTRVRFKPYLLDIAATVRNGQFWALPISYRDLLQNSLWVSAPMPWRDGWAMWVVMVNLPDEDPDARLAWLRSVVSSHGMDIAEVPEKNGPVPISPSDTPLFRLLAREAQDRYRVAAGTEILYRSVSEARLLRPLGIVCYGLSPYPVDLFQSVTIHKNDERIRLDYFNDGVEFLRGVVARWAAGEQ